MNTIAQSKDMLIWKKVFVLLICLLAFVAGHAQKYNKNDTLRFDLDLDQKLDLVIFDRTKDIIVCKLSTKNFVPIQSLALASEEPQSGIRKNANGFTYFVPYMRSGYHCDFTYHKVEKKIQLTAMDRYEFGPANNNGSGESSVNLLTHQYEGNWNYYDMEIEELVKLPTIKRRMVLPKTYLENFTDDIAYKYANNCAALFEGAKQKYVDAEELRRFTIDSLVTYRRYKDALGTNSLMVKVINPCNADSSVFDGALAQITVTLKNTKSISYTYRHPDPEMSLIDFRKDEIVLRDFNGKKAVFIPFYYCGGYETYDRKVSYIILYNNKSYSYHLDYYCKGAQDCSPVKSFETQFKDLPPAIRLYFIKFLNNKYKLRASFHQEE